jgi:hypothetical protein
VAITVRFYYDVTIAVALTTVFALVVALIAAVIVGGIAPNISVAIIVFALTGAMLLFRWRRDWHRLVSRSDVLISPLLMGLAPDRSVAPGRRLNRTLMGR